ncbi:MAG: hypothetical protein LLG05_10005, partial [Porphyromonadaceae bacterium]|nr:hypothetical protein [Porphyromonadaceae bacterium]
MVAIASNLFNFEMFRHTPSISGVSSSAFLFIVFGSKTGNAHTSCSDFDKTIATNAEIHFTALVPRLHLRFACICVFAP